MSILASWGDVITASFQGLWLKSFNILPNILGAVIIFIVGLFVAEGLGRLMAAILKRIYLDQAVEKSGLKRTLEKIGFRIDISKGIGLLVTWFLYVVFLVAVAEILNLSQITEFLKTVVLYIPNVIIAIVILVIGVIAANFISTIVKEAASAAKLALAEFLAGIAKWAILIFSVMAALVQLGIATDLIRILFTGLVFMIALAGGLAFGLGGKDKAAEILEKISKGKKG